jgi:hypothetical protein
MDDVIKAFDELEKRMIELRTKYYSDNQANTGNGSRRA